MLMRLIVGVAIFSLGYYVGRESALNEQNGALASRNPDYLRGDFDDVDAESEEPRQKG